MDLSRLVPDSTKALAFAIAALGRADTNEARRLALRALWAGPPATVLEEFNHFAFNLAFSPDGRFLAASYLSASASVRFTATRIDRSEERRIGSRDP